MPEIKPENLRINGVIPTKLVKKVKFDKDNWQRHLRKVKDEKGLK